MNEVTGYFENRARNISEAWDELSETMENTRKSAVQYVYAKAPRPVGEVVDKISRAVPETFAALASLCGGILVLPALLITTVRKIGPMIPLVKTICAGDLSAEGLGQGCRKMLDRFQEMFEDKLVPALFVALAVDMAYSFAMGWLCQDWGRMLHATAVALPGAWLAMQHLMTKKESSAQELRPIPIPVVEQ